MNAPYFDVLLTIHHVSYTCPRSTVSFSIFTEWQENVLNVWSNLLIDFNYACFNVCSMDLKKFRGFNETLNLHWFTLITTCTLYILYLPNLPYPPWNLFPPLFYQTFLQTISLPNAFKGILSSSTTLLPFIYHIMVRWYCMSLYTHHQRFTNCLAP